LSSLSAYLVLAQDEPKAWIWVRGETGFSPGLDVIVPPNGIIAIAALGINLPLSEITTDLPAR
jgi:hypothetical protein